MTYLYIDESGDLGFGKRGSRYFVITCIKIDDEKTNISFRRIPRTVRRKLLKKKFKKMSELKFSNSTDLVRKRFLELASKLDIEIYSLVVRKELTAEKLRNNLPILYNYLIKILLEKVLRGAEKNPLNICLDRCMSASQRENFEAYIKTEFFHLFRDIPELKISHENSNSNEGLQVADFICGAFGYKHNTSKPEGDSDRYTSMLKGRISLEKNDLFKE